MLSTVADGLSSMKNLSHPSAFRPSRRSHSEGVILLSRMLPNGMCINWANTRLWISSLDISSVHISTAPLPRRFTAACNPINVLPLPGRAPITYRAPGRHPPIRWFNEHHVVGVNLSEDFMISMMYRTLLHDDMSFYKF